jgi:CheY-like chemotaxis protein
MQESKRILLVGGGLTEFVIRTFVLEEHGFKVTAVGNYGAAEPLLRHTDLVILDWASADATSALRFIRETSPECPVIVIASVPISDRVREDATAIITHSALNSSLLPVVQFAIHPMSRAKTRTPKKVPLGIGDHFVSVGQHLLLFWEKETELQSLTGFLVAGLATNDRLVLCGPPPANSLLTNMLEERGLPAEELSSRGRLSVLEAEDTQTAVPKLLELCQSPELRSRVIRVVANSFGWNHVSDEDGLIRGEGEIDRALANYACVTICPYRTHGMSSRTMFDGALRNHASVIVDNTVRENPFYRPLS